MTKSIFFFHFCCNYWLFIIHLLLFLNIYLIVVLLQVSLTVFSLVIMLDSKEKEENYKKRDKKKKHKTVDFELNEC